MEHPRFNARYEDYSDIIDNEIAKRKHRWRLGESILSVEWKDIEQKLRIHVFKKFHQYDPKRNILNWLNKILSNQIFNQIRDEYGHFQSPCVRCPLKGDGDVCNVFGKQKSPNCSDFSKWDKGKRYKMELAMPQSMDAAITNDQNDSLKREIADKRCNFTDFERLIPEFNKLMKDKLNNIEWRVYSYLYIDNLSEVEVAEKMKYKTTEENKMPGYKRIAKLKTIIYTKAKKIVEQMEF